jgi:hypothetical protein
VPGFFTDYFVARISVAPRKYGSKTSGIFTDPSG